MSEFTMSIEPRPTSPTVERILREEAFVMPARALDPKDMIPIADRTIRHEERQSNG